VLLDISVLQTMENKLNFGSVVKLKNVRAIAPLPGNEMQSAKYILNIQSGLSSSYIRRLASRLVENSGQRYSFNKTKRQAKYA